MLRLEEIPEIGDKFWFGCYWRVVDIKHIVIDGYSISLLPLSDEHNGAEPMWFSKEAFEQLFYHKPYYKLFTE